MKNRKIIIPALLLSALLLMPYKSIAQFTIGAGATVTITGSATFTLQNVGFTNNGTYTKGTETVTFTGTEAKTISGSSNTGMYNVQIQNTGGIETQVPLFYVYNDLTVAASCFFTVAAGKAVTVDGATTNSSGEVGGFSISSDASGCGSFIYNGSISGDIAYSLYLSSPGWHLMSTPATNQSINDFATDVGNSIEVNTGYSPNRYGIGYYNENTNTWSLYNTDNVGSAGNFTSGKGYEVRRSASGTVFISGSSASSATSPALARTAVTNAGWNLVGNPFTSFMNGNSPTGGTNFLVQNAGSLDPSYTAIYYWNGTGYEAINNSSAANTVPPGQGFFARAADNSGATVSYTSSMRTHTSNTYKSGRILWPEVELIATFGTKTSTTVVRFIPDMTLGLDPGYDAGAFEQNPTFGIATRLVEDNGINFAIQCLPDQDYQELTIPVVLNAQAGSEVTLSANGTQIARLGDIYLEDRLTGRSIRLDDSGNSLTVALQGSASGAGRFFITNQLGYSGIGNEKLNPIKVISIPSQNVVRVSGSVMLPAQATIYDLNGRVLISVALTDETLNEIPFNQSINGIYILQISSGKNNVREKINWVR